MERVRVLQRGNRHPLPAISIAQSQTEGGKIRDIACFQGQARQAAFQHLVWTEIGVEG